VITAVIQGEDDVQIVVLGITSGNVARLIAGAPIRVDAVHHPGFPEKLKVCIVYGETERDLTDLLTPMISEDTQLIFLPQEKDRPKGVS
jgi:hypothetical protein